MKTRVSNILSIIVRNYAELSAGKLTDPGGFSFVYISSLRSSNLVLIPGAKLDSYRGT